MSIKWTIIGFHSVTEPTAETHAEGLYFGGNFKRRREKRSVSSPEEEAGRPELRQTLVSVVVSVWDTGSCEYPVSIQLF